MSDCIDFVLPWVDGSDPAWLAEKKQYMPAATEDDRDIRYRDWGLLRYWFRAVEKNAPWVHKVFFITWGHIPEWLNTGYEKLAIINHKDYIPDEYLPTFSSHGIELNLHRIKELGEHFVYFNDDVYLLNEVKAEDFFVNGLPCDCLVESAITPRIGEFSSILCETVGVINKHFKKSDILHQGFKKYWNPHYKKLLIRSISMRPYTHIMGFYNHHISQAHLKSTFEEVWDLEFEELNRTCLNRFRGQNDVSQYLFRYWNLCKGRFYPKYPIGKYVNMTEDIPAIIETIKSKKNKVLTINDSDRLDNAQELQKSISDAFKELYPQKSHFEKW